MQQINLEQIQQIAFGAAEVKEVDHKILLSRFTDEQKALYERVSADFYMKSHSTAGVSLEFFTDSSHLNLCVSVSPGSSRRYFTHSIFVNGNRVDELAGVLKEGEAEVLYRKEFQLGSGEKKVRIAFPWSVESKLVALELEEGAYLSPVVKNCKMLMFGDSITQGYDASKTENAYAVKLSELLNADARNKGIGGECFRGDLAALKEDFEPDLITVAYGTNDWGKRSKERFEKECKAFYYNLKENYPNARIFALAPVWRADEESQKAIGVPLGYIAQYIKNVVKDLEHVTVIDCLEFIPHCLEYYQTDGLHPLDAGFSCYIDNLWKEIESYLAVRRQ